MVLEKTIRTKRVNRYTSMRRNGNTFIFPSTVGLNGKILEPKNGMNYPLAELINGSKAQSGGYRIGKHQSKQLDTEYRPQLTLENSGYPIITDFVTQKMPFDRNALGNQYADYVKWANENSKLVDKALNSNPLKRQQDNRDKAIRYQIRRLHHIDKPAEGSYNNEEKRYYAFGSAEGGNQTIGYGLKLFDDQPWTKRYNENKNNNNGIGYLTEEEHDKFLYDRVAQDYDAVRDFYDKTNNDQGAFEKLTPEWQAFLMDYNYNPGITLFPKLIKAVYNNDVEAIKKEGLRYMGKLPLGRNKIMLNDIDLINSNKYIGVYE